MLASNFIKPDITVHLQSENGILGLVSRPQASIFPLQVSLFQVGPRSALVRGGAAIHLSIALTGWGAYL